MTCRSGSGTEVSIAQEGRCEMFTLEQAREYFQNDRYATSVTGIEIDEIGEGYARVSCKLDERHMNARGAVMGGVMFTMADFAFAVASNSGGREVVSMQNQISYLSSPKGHTLYAAANCIKSGRSTCLYEVVVTDDTGRMVAFTTVSGFVVGERK